MGTTRALLVGVGEYPRTHLQPLPLCINDLHELKSALISGLNLKEDNIWVCGETGTVTLDNLIHSINAALSGADKEDVFIFYFSGHGGSGCLALSDKLISLQELIDTIEKVPVKSKIVILDSCHSGGFSVDGVPQIDINANVEHFAGCGYAVMASCGAGQTSGFDINRKISLYTRFVCDALTSRFLIRQGKISLESINEAIFHFAKLSNKRGEYNIQQPIFRANMGGTIFFDVEEYNPYQVAKVYEETDKYIIYDVEPVHHGLAKRFSVKVILRFPSTLEEIAEMANEIKDKIRYCDVYQNRTVERYHKGKPANIVWCYFGYDENDMVNTNFICNTTWVDDSQDKGHWYNTGKNTSVINNIHLRENPSYAIMKEINSKEVDKDELIKITREYTASLIRAAEQYIKIFREYQNNTLTEEELIASVAPLNAEIEKWFFLQSDLQIPPDELYDWASAHTKISNTIHDLSLYYSERGLKAWSKENREYLTQSAIRQYEVELEELKEVDKTI